jgi:diguanylate cyclase (GGDEF)-like protein
MIDDNVLEDAHASSPVDRLLEDSWETRSRRTRVREVVSESIAAGLFLAIAGVFAAPALARHGLDWGMALLLVGLYAVVARGVKFPIGAGYVVPSYLVLVPMLVLLPPSTVPLLAATGLLLGTVGRLLARQAKLEELLFSVPDAWHALGPAVVLTLAGAQHGVELAGVYVAAFSAGCLLDLVSSSLREALALGVAPRLQLRVLALVWVIDACIAPAGLALARSGRHDHAELLVVVPLSAVLFLLDRERNKRIVQANDRLALIGRERRRLQAAVERLGEAFAAKLDLRSIAAIVLHGSIDALDADAGRLTLPLSERPALIDTSGDVALTGVLEEAVRRAQSTGRPVQLERDGAWALALPLADAVESGCARGGLAVARYARAFAPDEQALMAGLLERAHTAISEILTHDALREQAMKDPLTGLGNRRQLAITLADRHAQSTQAAAEPWALMVFDLDGFKAYNDTFGHMAGDALLARLAGKLAAAVSPDGDAYRLGGDEFCALVPARSGELRELVARAATALCERGERFSITASCGAVLIPHEASTPEYALQLADERMYARKQSRSSPTGEQTRDVLVRIMHAKQPNLPEHSTGVSQLAVDVGRRLGMNAEELDEVARAAELHDIGKVGIPDAILDKPGPLDDEEWEFIRQHPVVGERILSAAPALRPVAKIVRAHHERWDGGGYPDQLMGKEIPLAARIVAVCDAYHAMTTERCYRPARTVEAACAELLNEAGRQFDPLVVDAFLDQLREPQAHPRPSTISHLEVAWLIGEEIESRLGQIFEVQTAPGATDRSQPSIEEPKEMSMTEARAVAHAPAL